MKKVIVIGAGLSGLTLARSLSRKGHEVIVLDRRERIGGAISSEWTEGFLCEAGPNTMQINDPQLDAFIRDLGIADQVVIPGEGCRKRFVVRDGEPVALPMNPKDFLRSRILSCKGKLRLLREPLVSPHKGKEEESFASFVRRRMGDEVYTYLAEPFVSGIYAGDPEKLSTKWAFPRVWKMEQESGSLFQCMLKKKKERKKNRDSFTTRMVSFRNGLGTITDALAEEVGDKLVLGAFVEKVENTERGWAVTYRQAEEQYTLQADNVCLAIPAHRVSELNISAPVSELLKDIGSISYPPVSVVHLGFKRDQVEHALDGFGMLFPSAEKRRVLGTIFTSSLFPGRCPAGHVLLTTFVGGARQAEIARYDDASLYECVLSDIVPLLRIHGEPVLFRRYHWEKAIPQYNIGYGKTLAAIDKLEGSLPGLSIVGNYRDGISLGNVIMGALNRAEKIHREIVK